ncbi:DUF397 domain-containing protein [Actinomadura chokoriensis]|uniref:DUF397 domain-containing protein n=1 Tax=Actinomadura chokoriensis TaxID=454156 RepID=A0ABV4QQS4_9ACTN
MNVSKAVWRKSSRSSGNGGACVEVAGLSDAIGIRDSKDPYGPRLIVGRSEFAALLATLKH